MDGFLFTLLSKCRGRNFIPASIGYLVRNMLGLGKFESCSFFFNFYWPFVGYYNILKVETGMFLA